MLDSWIEYFALFAAKVGPARRGARILGWADGLRSRHATNRHLNEARSHASALALLYEAVPAPELAKLRAEGAVLTDPEGCELVASLFA